MAMLEGHELEKELLSVVSILSLVGFPFSFCSFLFPFCWLNWPWVSVQLICSQDKEVFWVSCSHHAPSQLIFNIIEE